MLRLRQDVLEVLQSQCLHLGSDWHSALKLNDEICRLLLFKSTCANEENIPRVHLRLRIYINGCAVQDWQ